MTEPLDIDVIEDATHGLLDHNENPMIDDKDHQVQFINNAANVLLDRVKQGEDMDDEASNYVVWLGSLDRDVMLYGLQLILRPEPLNVVFEDKAQARIDTMQERLEAATGYVANNFETIDHHAWPAIHVDGSTQDERVEQILDEEAETNKPDLPTADMVLNGIDYEQVLDPAHEYALGVAICYELKDYYEATKGKDGNSLENRIFHEKMDNYLGWSIKASVEIATLTGRTLLVIFGIKFDPNKTKNWEAYSVAHQDLILK